MLEQERRLLGWARRRWAGSGHDLAPRLPRSPARATLPNAGSANADNSIKAAISNQLVYVITWQGVPCRREGGPAPLPGAPSTSQSTYVCTIINLVDAATGKFLYGVQSTNP